MRRTAACCVVMVVVVACGTNGLPQEVVDDMTTRLDLMNRSEATHGTAVLQTTTTVEAALALEDEHWNAGGNDFTAVRGDLDKLSTCYVRGGALDTSEMHDSLQDARAEGSVHDLRMRTIPTFAGVIAEENRHQAAMRDAFTDLQSQQTKLVHSPQIVCP